MHTTYMYITACTLFGRGCNCSSDDDCMTKEAYAAVLQAMFECCNQDNRVNVLNTLKGVIVDWATAQIEGLKEVAKEQAEQLLKGCQVAPPLNPLVSLFGRLVRTSRIKVDRQTDTQTDEGTKRQL